MTPVAVYQVTVHHQVQGQANYKWSQAMARAMEWAACLALKLVDQYQALRPLTRSSS